jgi:cytochrome c-type biogenesis protein CcmH
MIWVLAALIATLVGLALILPLMRLDTTRGPDPLGPFRSQLEELRRDVALGLIPEAEARAVELEIQRRLLAADAARPAADDEASGLARQVGLGVVAAALIGAVGVYVFVGRPDLASGRGETPVARLEMAPAATPEEMVQRLSDRLRFEPDNGQAWGRLGRSRLVLGEVELSAQAYARALMLIPDDPAIRAGAGEAMMALGEYDMARAHFGEAIALVEALDEDAVSLGERAWLYAQYGDSLGWMGRLDEAAAAMRQALVLDPEIRGVRSRLGQALIAAAQGQVTEEASEQLRLAVEESPNDFWARFYLAEALVQDGDADAAIAAFTALSESLDEEEARALLARRIEILQETVPEP